MDIFTPKEELIKEKESEELVRYLSAKNNIMSVIGMDNLIKEITNVIDKSEKFSFRSEMARYVDEFNPVFIIKYKEENQSKTTGNSEKLEEIYFEKTMDEVYEDIILPTGSLLEKTIENSELLKSANELEKELTGLLLSNMFGVSVGRSSENIIHLRLIL